MIKAWKVQRALQKRNLHSNVQFSKVQNVHFWARFCCKHAFFILYKKHPQKCTLHFSNCSFECKLHFKSKFCIFEKCTFECRLGFRSAIFMCSFCFKTSMLVMCFLWDCVFAKKTCVDCLRSCCSFPNPMCRFAEFRVLLSFIFMHIGAEQRLSVGLPKMVNSRLVGVLFSMFWGAKTR